MTQLQLGRPQWEKRAWAFAGALAIACVILVIYGPALSIGFWTDDYSFIDTAGRLAWPDYLSFYFDPRLLVQWYRPLQGMLWWITVGLFRGDPVGYHWVQILFHLANSLMLYGLVARLSCRWQFGLLAALVYASFPAYSLAVFWPAVADPLAGVFFLLTLWFWVDYLARGGALRYALAYTAFVLALLSKEINVVLPVTLFLLDIWVVRRTFDLRASVGRYAIFFLTLPLYGLCEWNVFFRGTFTQSLGYSLGGHILSALIREMAVLAFPWGLPMPIGYLPLVGAGAFLVYALIRRRMQVIFLASAAILAVLPVLPFPSALALAPRYLYLSLMASAIGGAAIIHALVLRSGGRAQWTRPLVALALVAVIIGESFAIGDSASSFAASTRETRLQFRPIFQRHPAFEGDTLLYFIDPPFPTPNISGLMYVRYGGNVSVYGSERDGPARLRSHTAAFVYYPEEAGTWKEQAVEKSTDVQSAPALPIYFGDSLSLGGFELASGKVGKGDAVVLILYWRYSRKMDKDYTVFSHLVDANGKVVAGYDNLLRAWGNPTSTWRQGELPMVAHAIVIPIDEQVPPGTYQVEVGLYYLPTLERLPVRDAQGQSVGDQVTFAPIQVGP